MDLGNALDFYNSLEMLTQGLAHDLSPGLFSGVQ